MEKTVATTMMVFRESLEMLGKLPNLSSLQIGMV